MSKESFLKNEPEVFIKAFIKEIKDFQDQNNQIEKGRTKYFSQNIKIIHRIKLPERTQAGLFLCPFHHRDGRECS